MKMKAACFLTLLSIFAQAETSSRIGIFEDKFFDNKESDEKPKVVESPTSGAKRFRDPMPNKYNLEQRADWETQCSPEFSKDPAKGRDCYQKKKEEADRKLKEDVSKAQSRQNSPFPSAMPLLNDIRTKPEGDE